MHSELLSLYSGVYLPRSTLGAPNAARLPLVHLINKEVSLFGYTMTPQLIDALSRVPDQDFKAVRDRIIETLSENNGANVYGTLFRNFPYDTPEQNDYLFRRIIGYFQNVFGDSHGMRVLSCGHAIDKGIFNLDEFGACPICQEQVPELHGATLEATPFKRVTKLRPLFAYSEQSVGQKITSLLGRMASLSDTEKSLVSVGLRASEIKAHITYPAQVFKETLPFLYEAVDDLVQIKGWISGATDILRIAAYVSAPATADLSLASNTKFRLTKSHRRRLLTLLDQCEDIAPDMMRHREKWLRLGEELRPASEKNRFRYPNAVEAFDILRNRPKTIETYTRVAERAIRSGKNIDRQTMLYLAHRPGEFARRLDALMRRSDQAVLFEATRAALPDVRTQRLMELHKYITRALSSNLPSKRIFIPKGSMTKIKLAEDHRPRLLHGTAYGVRIALSNELEKRLRKLGNMGTVYLDPALKKVVLPFNTRGASDTAFPVSRGSAYPVFADGEQDKVVRLFCYWKEDTDLDLSAMFLDSEFGYAGHVSFTRLRDGGVVHSGDITNGSLGASEYIDFRPAELKAAGRRYVAIMAISYRDVPFEDYEEAFAGFMVRDGLTSGELYEPASVQMKFKLKGSATQCMPLIFDLEDNTVIFADLTVTGGAHGRIEKGSKVALMTEAVVTLPLVKPTVYDVIEAHGMARRARFVENPELADRVFDITTDVNAIVEEFVQIDAA